MDKFLEDFVGILKYANYSNTYKMAWAKSLVEISLEKDYSELDEIVHISLEEIARKFIKYYYNHTMFFNLEQGTNPKKKPEMIAHVSKLIDKTYDLKGTKQPLRYEKAQTFLKNHDIFKTTIVNTIKTLKYDVSYRFLNLNGEKLTNIYQYEKGNDYLEIDKLNLKILKDHAFMLFDIINYRWSLILETMNSSPRISKKVKIIDEKNIRRKPLNKYFELIELDNPSKTCFLCGKEIQDTPAIDHVIPWSYLYSDDLWNLVFVHQSCNSTKTNSIPDINTIKKLEQRNTRLINIMEKHNMNNKLYNELILAKNENLVRKFWIGCQ